MSIFLDTGVLAAFANREDGRHVPRRTTAD